MSARTWLEVAREARNATQHLRYGQRRAGLELSATRREISADTLRRALSALNFIESLARRDRSLSEALSQAPLAAIDHLSRWYRHDPNGALIAARELAAGQLSVRTIQAKERAARATATKGAESGRGFKHTFRRKVYKLVLEADPDLQPITPPKVEFYPPVDFALQNVKTGEVGAVLIAGPYRDVSLYRAKMAEWLLRSIGLLHLKLFNHVWVAVPAGEVAELYTKWLNLYEVSKVEVLPV